MAIGRAWVFCTRPAAISSATKRVIGAGLCGAIDKGNGGGSVRDQIGRYSRFPPSLQEKEEQHQRPVEPNPPGSAHGILQRLDLVQQRRVGPRPERVERSGRRARWRNPPLPRLARITFTSPRLSLSTPPACWGRGAPCLSASPERGRTCTS